MFRSSADFSETLPLYFFVIINTAYFWLPFSCPPYIHRSTFFLPLMLTHMHFTTPFSSGARCRQKMPIVWIMLMKQELIPIRLEQGGRVIPFCTTPVVTQTRSTPPPHRSHTTTTLYYVCIIADIHTDVTHNTLNTHGIVMSLSSQTEFCLLNISCLWH